MFGRTHSFGTDEIPVTVCHTADDVRRTVRRNVPRVPVVRFTMPAPVAEQIALPTPPELEEEFPIPLRPDGPRALVIEVCKRNGVKLADFYSKSRKAPIVQARQEVAYRLRTERHLTLPTIGRLCGRDHTTVLHAVRRYAKINGLPEPKFDCQGEFIGGAS